MHTIGRDVAYSTSWFATLCVLLLHRTAPHPGCHERLASSVSSTCRPGKQYLLFVLRRLAIIRDRWMCQRGYGVLRAVLGWLVQADFEHHVSSPDVHVLGIGLYGECRQVPANVGADRTECYLLEVFQSSHNHNGSSVRSTIESWQILHSSEWMACPGSTLAHLKEQRILSDVIHVLTIAFRISDMQCPLI